LILNTFVALALIPTLGQPPEHQITPVDFVGPITTVTASEPRGVLRMLSNLPLGDLAQPVFDTDFSRATYFSAFALSKDGGYGYAVSANSLGAARDMAMVQCQSENSRCTIVSEIVPQGYRDPAPGEVFLNPEIAGYYFNPGPEVNGMRAMAISEDGAWSLSWGFATQAEADADALKTCQANRSPVIAGQIDWPCFVVPGAAQ
jgi:hypothetical protein